MTDKSHCKLFTDGDAALEFADFYDFRSFVSLLIHVSPKRTFLTSFSGSG